LTKKYNLIGRLQYDLTQFFYNLVVANFFGPPCIFNTDTHIDHFTGHPVVPVHALVEGKRLFLLVNTNVFFCRYKNLETAKLICEFHCYDAD